MDLRLKARISAWPERNEATSAMIRATRSGDIEEARALLSKFPLLDYWVPFNAHGWSQLAAAAGQLELMKFWRKREKKTLPVRKRPTAESLLWRSMGNSYFQNDKGDLLQVATYLLDEGAKIEGDLKDCSPLHMAVFANRPELIDLLIRRGANLSRRYATGESALEIAKRVYDKRCARLLKAAGAPLELPPVPERGKPIRTVDLRASARKLESRIPRAVRSFARQHRRDVVTVIALASTPHEGYVMISLGTGAKRSPWDCEYTEFALVKFPDWRAAHDRDVMRLIDVDGRTREGEPDEFLPRFKKMIVDVLAELERKGIFDVLTTSKDCQIGIEMTSLGESKFWKLRHRKRARKTSSRAFGRSRHA